MHQIFCGNTKKPLVGIHIIQVNRIQSNKHYASEKDFFCQQNFELVISNNALYK